LISKKVPLQGEFDSNKVAITGTYVIKSFASNIKKS